MTKLTRPMPSATESLRPEPSNWFIALGLSDTWTLELPIMLADVLRDPEDTAEPDTLGITTACAVVPEIPPVGTVADDTAGIKTSVGECALLDPCSFSNPIANEVWPLAPTTGVARTASEVKPLAPTTGVRITAGEVKPFAAAIGVEKTAREVSPFAPTTGEGTTAREVKPFAPARAVKRVSAG